MRQRITVLAIAIAAGGLAACGGAVRPSKYYALEVPATPSAAAAANPYPVALLVGRLTAPHLYRDDRIVYRTGPEQLGTYDYHRWAEPPTEMVEAALLRMLRESGRYRTVQTLRSNAQGDYILRGRLHNFEEISGSQIAARVAIEIELYEIKTGTTVWTQFYSYDEPVNGKDVPAVVQALDRNVRRGLEQVVRGLEQYFVAHLPK
ncbi:MAG: membrane integrity-associated transporter subunit PqiC [Acidobacteria bacterium]|nr:membrane integrity-associated transporter subunit PqiC [Acidobacteriota bacterium]